MATTPRRGLRYPAETDSPDVPRDIKNLASDADAEDPGQPPIGSEMEYAGEGDPNANWMVEDGRAISRATYATLFARLGTKWGAGDGSSTFNLPDSRGRVSVGAGAGSGLTARAVAAKFGEETHKLSTGEMPSHTHTAGQGVWEYAAGGGGATNSSSAPQPMSVNFAGVDATGGDGAHNTMQPSVAKTKIIRVL